MSTQEINTKQPCSGILLVNKPKGKSSFFLIHVLRKKLGIRKIGHCGTLDPFAEGVMVMLIGREYTKLQANFLKEDKEYRARLRLGLATDTFDVEGKELESSEKVPEVEEIDRILTNFQGQITQIPPMFSAKKVRGKRLYTLARQGISIERKEVSVTVATTLNQYAYPFLDLHFCCTSGTYIRSLADEIGRKLQCYAHLTQLVRTKSGRFSLEECLTVEDIDRMDISSIRQRLLSYENH